VTHTDRDRMSHQLIAIANSASGADLLNDLDASALAVAQDAVSGVESVWQMADANKPFNQTLRSQTSHGCAAI
jgi:hypothetical protein